MGNLKGMGLLLLEINALISSGKKETVTEIKNHLDSKDLIEYIANKYDKSLSIKFDGKIYNNKALNAYFSNYSSYIEGNESAKYGICNEEDGLLLIIGLISDRVEEECRKWEIEY